MASQRLTNQLRTEIIDSAMVGAFKKEREANKQARIDLTGRVYRRLVTEEQEKAMKKFPPGFFHSGSGTRYIYIGADDSKTNRFTLDFGTVSRMLPANCQHNFTVIDAKINQQADKITEMDESIKNRTNELREKISQVVNSVGSVAKLLEVWPEAEPFIPVASAPVKSNLPAVIVKDLMAALMSAKGEKPAKSSKTCDSFALAA